MKAEINIVDDKIIIEFDYTEFAQKLITKQMELNFDFEPIPLSKFEWPKFTKQKTKDFFTDVFNEYNFSTFSQKDKKVKELMFKYDIVDFFAIAKLAIKNGMIKRNEKSSYTFLIDITQ